MSSGGFKGLLFDFGVSSLNLENIVLRAEELFSNAENYHTLEQVKSKFLGKTGLITDQLKKLKAVPAKEKAKLGKDINEAKNRIEELLHARREEITDAELKKKISNSSIDVTLPGKGNNSIGSYHPITQTLDRISVLFSSMGFSIIDGPEIESDYYNFTALNQPENHPARSMHDTFYLLDHDFLLRTHTSPMQIRHMEEFKPPMRIVSPGRVYRVDSDATHSPMFHQLEGLWVDANVSFANLKGLMREFLRFFFERDDIEVRFRPSYFPFTEPSAEIDMLFDNAWLEIGGCGMVHPKVLNNVGIDTEKYQAFAFGMGLDRLAMIRYKVEDLRLFFESDIRFLKQFT